MYVLTPKRQHCRGCVVSHPSKPWVEKIPDAWLKHAFVWAAVAAMKTRRGGGQESQISCREWAATQF